MFIVALVPLILAFALLYTYFGDFVTAPVANFFFSSRSGQATPEEFSKVRGLLANRKFEHAVEELKLIIKQRPDLVSGKVLLINTLYENLNRPEEALVIAIKELEKEKWQYDHGKIVMSVVDILLENDEKGKAIVFLEKALSKINNHTLNAAFKKRLTSLKT